MSVMTNSGNHDVVKESRDEATRLVDLGFTTERGLTARQNTRTVHSDRLGLAVVLGVAAIVLGAIVATRHTPIGKPASLRGAGQHVPASS